jgi:hypothetical protein
MSVVKTPNDLVLATWERLLSRGLAVLLPLPRIHNAVQTLEAASGW